MKGRDIFGSLVPYDKMWRTGANENAKITFSDDVKFGETDVKAGTYAVYTKPGKSQWEIMLYSDTGNWGLPGNWDDSKVVAKAMAKPSMLNRSQESFTMAINEVTMDGAHLQMMWDKTLVAVPFTVPTAAKTLANIDKAMAGPGANDYYAAASFYVDANMDMKKAHDWISKAVDMRPEAFWMHTKKSLIEEKMGDKKAAIASAKKAMTIAKENDNADYVKINTDNLKKWGAKM
jgi:tetratricopeptide (TPR) repeat protein